MLTFEKVVVSPRLRARQTCELAGFGAMGKVEPELSEWDYGRYEGLRSLDMRQEKAAEGVRKRIGSAAIHSIP